MRSYDPRDHSATFNGIVIDGYAPGTFIKVSRNEDTYTFQPSNSGGGSRSLNPNKSGRYEFTLIASSPVNGYLSAIAVADELTGEGVGECTVYDRNTNTAKCVSANAWIIKPPDFERAKEAGEITWVIEAEEVLIAHDGLIDND